LYFEVSALEEKAKQLALTSKYKSEFLANMSHELRTPLNSLLILSDQLYKNQDGNLTPRQVDFAKTIHASGNDLLALINDILDLSKIESGTVTVEPSELVLADLQDYVERTFKHVAENKGLTFALDTANEVPKTMHTDSKRLQQVLKNLLSNAFKFTEEGTVALKVEAATSGWSDDNDSLNRAKSVISFSVSDTGIGIHPDKQQIIFEAFQQADGSTSRKYGGTGLGLAISREISRMLGGEIRLHSTPGQGSTFTLYLPATYVPPKAARKIQATATDIQQPMSEKSGTRHVVDVPALAEVPVATVLNNEVGDDRRNIKSNDKVVLIVDNDLGFARILMEVAHDAGFKALVTSHGAVAIALAQEYKPDAITLDIRLPDVDGWRVLDRLKNNFATRHIAVYIISATEDRARGLAQGAIGFLNKPVKTKEPLEKTFGTIKDFIHRQVRNLLVVEQDETYRGKIIDLIGNGDVSATSVGSAEEATKVMLDRHFDGIVLGQQLKDGTGIDLMTSMMKEPALREIPVIFNLTRELEDAESEQLSKLTQMGMIRTVRSAERLLDETSLVLHRVLQKLAPEKRQMLERLHQTCSVLAGKKVLIVDDDIRNIFAMMSVLERHKMNIVTAETGRDAIDIIQKTPDLNVVLMDIMMPAMDGYDTMREIRKDKKFKHLPIVAVTAKAMKGDREKCIEAGATDYLAKPVDTEQLLSMLRVLLYR
jgi:CheY-like chemotaxis protein